MATVIIVKTMWLLITLPAGTGLSRLLRTQHSHGTSGASAQGSVGTHAEQERHPPWDQGQRPRGTKCPAVDFRPLSCGNPMTLVTDAMT